MQGKYDFPDTVKNDTFEGVVFTVTVNTVALNLTNASIKMQLRNPDNYYLALELSTDNLKIEITNAMAGIFSIVKQIVIIPAMTYIYDIQITLGDGSVKTYIAGTWKILQDVTE
jgi:hypothetical protein